MRGEDGNNSESVKKNFARWKQQKALVCRYEKISESEIKEGRNEQGKKKRRELKGGVGWLPLVRWRNLYDDKLDEKLLFETKARRGMSLQRDSLVQKGRKNVNDVMISLPIAFDTGAKVRFLRAVAFLFLRTCCSRDLVFKWYLKYHKYGVSNFYHVTSFAIYAS